MAVAQKAENHEVGWGFIWYLQEVIYIYQFQPRSTHKISSGSSKKT